jgi:hypothetical protein
VANKVLALKGRVVEMNDISNASIFVVHDLGNPGDRIAWWVGLVGGFLITPDLKPTSPFLQFDAAVKHPLKLWVSHAMRKKHPMLYSLITKAVASPASKWKLLASKEMFIVSVKKAAGVRTKGICTKSQTAQEKDFIDKKVAKHVTTKDSFLQYVTRVISRKMTAQKELFETL